MCGKVGWRVCTRIKSVLGSREHVGGLRQKIGHLVLFDHLLAMNCLHRNTLLARLFETYVKREDCVVWINLYLFDESNSNPNVQVVKLEVTKPDGFDLCENFTAISRY
jgi:hypothetical protein